MVVAWFDVEFMEDVAGGVELFGCVGLKCEGQRGIALMECVDSGRTEIGKMAFGYQ